MFISYRFISWFKILIRQAILAQQGTSLADIHASEQNSKHCPVSACSDCWHVVSVVTFPPNPVWAYWTKIMDFKFQVMEMRLIKRKYGLGKWIITVSGHYSLWVWKSMQRWKAFSPLRGDSTRPLNIYGDTETQIAVCDFLWSSQPLFAVLGSEVQRLPLLRTAIAFHNYMLL